MKRYITYPILVCLAFFYVSCNQVIELDLPLPEDSIVVEGYIENGIPPYVLLTRSTPFFGGLSLTDISQYFINGAFVKVYNETDTVQLIELCLQDLPPSVQAQAAAAFGYNVTDSTADIPNICIYTVPNFINYYLGDTAGVFVGQFKTSYNLLIEVEGQTLTASTYIPDELDITLSIRPHDDPTKDSLVSVRVTYDDPDTTGNFLRYFTKRNDEPFYTALSGSVYDDNVISGQTVTLPVERGQSKNQDIDRTTYGYFWKGDTVQVRFSAISKSHYDFWHTLENDGGDSPFSSPITIKTNITGGLGIWGGYGSHTETIIIPE
jgi:hypothetical protein